MCLTVKMLGQGPITQVEMEQMPTILNDAKSDAEKNGIRLECRLQTLQYGDFLKKYAPQRFKLGKFTTDDMRLRVEELP